MISVKNISRMNRNKVIAHTGSVGGLMVLLVGVLLSLFVTSLAGLAGILMVIGLFASLIGIYIANRWVKKPRPEEVLDREFKSFTDAYRVYHYPSLPYDHVLLSPAGVTVFEVINLEGAFTYKDGKWSERINMGRALRYIVEEHLGDPIRDARDCAASLSAHLFEVTGKKVPVESTVVFIHPRAILEVQKPPIPVITQKKLRTSINVKAERMESDIYDKIMAYLDEKTIG